MTTTEDMMKNVATNVGVDVSVLKTRMESVLEEQGSAWRNAGKNDEECGVFALRVAARQLASESAKLKRSGAESLKGMFISVPRYKDWGQLLYRKMDNTLKMASEDVRESLVTQGKVVIFTDNYDGTIVVLSTHLYETKLLLKQTTMKIQLQSCLRISSNLMSLLTTTQYGITSLRLSHRVMLTSSTAPLDLLRNQRELCYSLLLTAL